MNSKVKIEGDIRQKAMLSQQEAEFYTGMGRNSLREWGKEIGAIRHRGKRIFYNREVIDDFLRRETEGGGDRV